MSRRETARARYSAGAGSSADESKSRRATLLGLCKEEYVPLFDFLSGDDRLALRRTGTVYRDRADKRQAFWQAQFYRYFESDANFPLCQADTSKDIKHIRLDYYAAFLFMSDFPNAFGWNEGDYNLVQAVVLKDCALLEKLAPSINDIRRLKLHRHAVRLCAWESLDYLWRIECKAFLDEGEVVLNVETVNEFGESILHVASMYRHVGVVKTVLETKPSLVMQAVSVETACGHKGEMPLHYAARYGCADTINKLVENGADVNLRSPCGKLTIHLAASNPDGKVTAALLKQGAKHDATVLARPDRRVMDRAHCTPMMIAASDGNKAAIQSLLASPEGRAQLGHQAYPTRHTPVMCAAQYGHHETLHFLLSHPEARATLGVQFDDGENRLEHTAMHLAIWFNSIWCAKEILSHAEGLAALALYSDQFDGEGVFTPLLYTVFSGALWIMKAILKTPEGRLRLADRVPEGSNSYPGMTAFMMALCQDRWLIAAHLLSVPEVVSQLGDEIPDDYNLAGMSILMCATQRPHCKGIDDEGREFILRLLSYPKIQATINQGVRRDDENIYGVGMTALMLLFPGDSFRGSYEGYGNYFKWNKWFLPFVVRALSGLTIEAPSLSKAYLDFLTERRHQFVDALLELSEEVPIEEAIDLLEISLQPGGVLHTLCDAPTVTSSRGLWSVAKTDALAARLEALREEQAVYSDLLAFLDDAPAGMPFSAASS